MFSGNWQPGVPKYNWVNWQWAGFTNHNKHRHSSQTAHFQRRITDCSIVFQINKYVNLTCFLNICKHIMVFLCFSRVKILHTAPLKCICCIFHLYVYFFLMDTNSRLYFQSVQFNGTGVVSGLLASPCCPVWYGRFILFYKRV